MLRAVALSIVLMWSVAPNLAALCSAWCDLGASTACHHSGASTSAPKVTGHHECSEMTLGFEACLREEGRRVVGPEMAEAALSVVPDHLQPTMSPRTVHETWFWRTLDDRPLVLSLRI